MKLPELKRRFADRCTVRMVAGALTLVLFGSSMGAYTVYADKDSGSAQEAFGEPQEQTKEKSEADSKKAADDAGKEETVYFISGADGAVRDTIVVDHLLNQEEAASIEDRSPLTEIENVRGEESFTQSGDLLTWQADGSDIYYQGKISKEAPISQTVTYLLDGEEMTPQEIAGKSGRVTIRFDYANNTSYTAQAGGRERTVKVPFAAVTVLMLDDGFSNVEVENGKVEMNGDREVVIGYALPGLKESLGIEETDLKDDVEIPEYFELTADVEYFELSYAMTVAVNANDILSTDGDKDMDDRIDDLDKDIDKLADASEQLEEGSGELADGTDTLRSKMGDFADGMDDLSSGISDYLDGAAKLDDGIGTLKTGVDQLAGGASSLGDGVTKLKTGADSAVLGAKQLTDGYAGSKEQAGLVDGAAQVADGAAKLSDGAVQVADGAAQVDAGVDQLAANIGAMPSSMTAGVQNMLDEKINNTQASAVMKALGIGTVTTQNLDAAVSAVIKNRDAVIGVMMQSGLPQEQAAASYEQLTAGLYQAQGAMSVVASTTASLAGSAQDLQALMAGTESLKTGAAELKTGAANLKTGASTVSKGVKKVSKGTTKLSAGLVQLQEGLDALNARVPDLTGGIAALAEGTKQLAEGSSTLVSNNSRLSDGTAKLQDGTLKIVDGVDELAKGARKLSDGVIEFNEEGISKLVDAYNGDIQDLIYNLQTVMDAGEDYQTFTSLPDGTKGSVKFIYKLDAIKAEEEEAQ